MDKGEAGEPLGGVRKITVDPFEFIEYIEYIDINELTGAARWPALRSAKSLMM